MATQKIRLVQGDTKPQLILNITDQRTGLPVDLSDSSTSTLVLFREVGSDAIKESIPTRPIAGYMDPETEEVTTKAPYDIPGRGGRVVMDWTPDALDTAGEFEAEAETTFPDGTIQTAYNILRFQVREQF